MKKVVLVKDLTKKSGLVVKAGNIITVTSDYADDLVSSGIGRYETEPIEPTAPATFKVSIDEEE